MSRSLTVAAVTSLLVAALLYATLEHGRGLRAEQTLRELPRTARALLHIDAAALARTPAAKTLLSAFVADEQLSEIEAACGLDPLSALSELTVWVRGPEDQPFQSIGLMLRGASVDAATLADCHRQLVEARGGSVVRLDAPVGPMLASTDGRSAIALVDARTVVTGAAPTVAEAMAVQRRLMPSLLERPRMAALWPKLSRGAGIAAAFDPPSHWRSALERIAKLGDEASALDGLEALGASVQVGSQHTVRVYIDVASPERAAENAKLIQTWAASPPVAVQPPWNDVLRSARVEVRGSTVFVALDVSSLSSAR